MKLTWTDTEEIALQLLERFPDVDPLKVRFTDLFNWVTELEGFSGETSGNKERALEAIQMAWLEEKQDQDG